MCGSCSGGVRVRGSCCVGDLPCEGFTECVCYSVWRLLCIGIVVCGSCDVWRMQCERVVACGSCIVVESVCVGVMEVAKA